MVVVSGKEDVALKSEEGERGTDEPLSRLGFPSKPGKLLISHDKHFECRQRVTYFLVQARFKCQRQQEVLSYQGRIYFSINTKQVSFSCVSCVADRCKRKKSGFQVL